MFGFWKKKVLSPSGVQHVVEAMTADADSAAAARMAVGAGLRETRPLAYVFSSEKAKRPDASFVSPVTWIYGHCGSGKTETALFWARDALRSGHRVLFIDFTGCPGFRHRWAAEDIVFTDLTKADADTDIRTVLTDALSRRDPHALHVSLPNMLKKSATEMMSVFHAVFEVLRASVSENDVVVLNDLFAYDETVQQALTDLARKVRAGGHGHLISVSSYVMEFAATLEDAEVCLRWVSETTPSGFESQQRELMMAEPGTGFLRQDGVTAPFSGPYDANIPALAVWEGPVIGVLDAIRRAVTTTVDDDVQKLRDEVARASGYRSWKDVEKRAA